MFVHASSVLAYVYCVYCVLYCWLNDFVLKSEFCRECCELSVFMLETVVACAQES